MQIVIDIPRNIYNTIRDDLILTNEQDFVLSTCIYRGTVLPKGHGRLIDANKLLLREGWYGEHATYDNPMADGGLAIRIEDIENAPTIIEADE